MLFCDSAMIFCHPIRLTCSTESNPARIASLIDWMPWACAATLRPSLCSSSTIAVSSSRVYWGAREVAFREYAALGEDLDDVGLELHHLAHFGAGFPRSLVGDSGISVMEFGGEQIIVAVAAGDAERGTGNDHAGAVDVAGLDAVAEEYI